MSKPLIFCTEVARADYAKRLEQRFDLELSKRRPESGYWLELDAERLQLVTIGKHGAVFADFVGGAARHRREQGGGRGQPVARAIGLKGGQPLPTIVDATAGLGRDAFVLASLGCRVTLLERSPVAAALLYDALDRASIAPDVMAIVARMQLVHANAIDWLTAIPADTRPDVIYLDPMFPDTGKSAAAKKDMQAFQSVIGDDLDSAALLAAALSAARSRVVVKRPRLGETIAGRRPSGQIVGKSTRFDLYSLKGSATLNPADTRCD